MPNVMSEEKKQDKKHRYINRERSWLAFNERIILSASNPNIPLLERVRFLSIAANNLDEFYMVRLASLYHLQHHDDERTSIDGLKPSEQIPLLLKSGATQTKTMMSLWKKLRQSLKQENIHVLSPKELSEAEKKWLESYFLHNIFPVLTPMAIDASHPVPLIPCQGICLIIQLQAPRSIYPLNAFVPIPAQLPRFIRLPGSNARYIIIDHVIQLFLKHLFFDYQVLSQGLFRIIRNSELEAEEETNDLVGEYEKALRQRLHGDVILLSVNAHMPEHLRIYVAEQMKIAPNDMVVVDGILGINDIRQLIDEESYRSDLLYPPFSPRFPQRIKNMSNNLLEAIAVKDILIHHPYESFNVVVNFVQQAAQDPQVIAIKQTLYRTGDTSKIVDALIEAVHLGKSVTVLIEIKARFDEETNIRWAKNLEDAGVHVIYGVSGLKTHAKISLVTRREGDHLKSYVHFGTGNYNAKTAQIYADLSLLTADPQICYETNFLFNFMTGYTSVSHLKNLAVAPFALRPKLYQLIDQEIKNAKDGKTALICAKMNSLTDEDMIDKLYEASAAGVKIELFIRGACCLRAGVPGLSETISVKSIVGRFLEHSRIFAFANGADFPSPETVLYISSADWMYRNLDRRLEVMVPVLNETVKRQVLEQILFANRMDEVNSWRLRTDDQYEPISHGDEGFNAHTFFLRNQSLSGNGIGPYITKPYVINMIVDGE